MQKSLKISNNLTIGQGIVEFALTLPILLLLVFGLIEFGRLLFIYTVVTTSSREAARYGMVVGDNGAGTLQYRDCAGIQNAALRIGVISGLEASDIAIAYDRGPGRASLGICPLIPDAKLGDRIVITVTGTYTPMGIIPFFNFPPFPITSSSNRLILTAVPLVGVTPGAAYTAIPTNPPGGPTSTLTPTPPPTLTSIPTSTSTNTNTPVVGITQTAITPTPTSVIPTPSAPLNPNGGATKNGNKCSSIWFKWSTNPSWTSNPGNYPAAYQTYKDSLYQTSLASNDPYDSTWYTGISLNHNASVTLSVIGIFPGVFPSHEAWATFYCDKGNLTQAGSGVYP